MSEPHDTTAASALCTACALCCDGTLFASVKLRDDDLPLAARTPTGVVERNGHPAAIQPCNFLDGFVCTVYPSRYHACVRFRCRLLNERLAGAIDHQAALNRVGNARRLRDSVHEAARGVGIGDGMPEIRRTISAWRRERTLPLAPLMAALDIRLVALDTYVAGHFRDQGRLSDATAA